MFTKKHVADTEDFPLLPDRMSLIHLLEVFYLQMHATPQSADVTPFLLGRVWQGMQ